MHRPGWGQNKPPLGTPLDWGHPLTNGLYACWTLNEGGGPTAYDQGASRSNGTIQSTNAAFDAYGRFGSEYRYTATSGTSFFQFSNSAFDFERTQALSLEVWVYVPSASSQINAFGNYGSTSNAGISITINENGGRVNLNLKSSALNKIVVVTPNASITANKWYHILATYDGTSNASGCHIYLNGIDQTLTVFTNALTSSIKTGNNWCLGRSGAASGTGSIQDTRYAVHRIWKRVLTGNEIQQLYISPFDMYVAPRRRMIFAPVVPGNVNISVPVKAMTLTSISPTPKIILAPSVKTMALSINNPTPRLSVAPSSKALTFTKIAPAISAGCNVALSVKSMVFTTFAPVPKINLSPSSKAMTFTTFSPSLKLNLSPSTKTMSLTSYAPSPRINITPSLKALSFTTYNPSISAGASVLLSVKAMSLTTFTPTPKINLSPSSKSMAFNTFNPNFRINLAPSTKAMTFSLLSPIPKINISPTTSGMILTTYEPTITPSGDGVNIVLTVKAMSLNKFSPALSIRLSPPSKSLALSPVATIQKLNLSPTSKSMSLTGNNPSFSIGLTSPIKALTLTGISPTVKMSVNPSVKSMAISLFSPIPKISLFPSSVAMVLHTISPNIAGGASVAIPIKGMILTTFAPQVTTNTTTSGDFLPSTDAEVALTLYLNLLNVEYRLSGNTIYNKSVPPITTVFKR